MEISKIRPRLHFLTKIQNNDDSSCVFVMLFTVSLLLEPFGSRFIEV